MQIKRYLVCLGLGIFSACGSSSLQAHTGSLRLGVEFPQQFQTKLVPTNTHSVSVLVYGNNNPLSRPMLPCPLTASQNSTTMNNVPVGSQTVIVVAKDINGIILAAAKNQVNIQAGLTATVILELSNDFNQILSVNELTVFNQAQPNCDLPRPTPIPTRVPTATPIPIPTPRSSSTSATPTSIPIVTYIPVAPLAPPTNTPPMVVRLDQENPFKMKINQNSDGLLLEMSYTGSSEIAALIDKVEFYINGGKVASVGSAPFNYVWSTERRGEGQYTFQAVGISKDGIEIARSNPATLLLLVQYQTTSSGGNNGPNPNFCTPGIDVDGNIDLCEEGGASFSAEVTVSDGATGLDPIEVSSP